MPAIRAGFSRLGSNFVRARNTYDPVDLRAVDANTATRAELAAIVSMSEEVAGQIVAARSERPFRDWADLVARVVGLSAAQPAAFASICGLTVNGESLLGAPPDALMA